VSGECTYITLKVFSTESRNFSAPLTGQNEQPNDAPKVSKVGAGSQIEPSSGSDKTRDRGCERKGVMPTAAQPNPRECRRFSHAEIA
jgi:hypothetical protein